MAHELETHSYVFLYLEFNPRRTSSEKSVKSTMEIVDSLLEQWVKPESKESKLCVTGMLQGKELLLCRWIL